jgi:hypothetical protein
MYIQDLIFGRRVALESVPVTAGAAAEPVAVGFAEAAVKRIMPRAPAIDEDLEETAAAPRAWAEQVVLVSAGQALEDRQAQVIEEVARAHSPRIVTLQAGDWLVELVVANRRLMAARFAGAEGQEMHDLRRADQDEERAVALCRCLADRIARPVDLTLTSRHGSGVYAANAGLPPQLIFAGETAIRTAHRPPVETQLAREA